jgi:hypothetical protein
MIGGSKKLIQDRKDKIEKAKKDINNLKDNISTLTSFNEQMKKYEEQFNLNINEKKEEQIIAEFREIEQYYNLCIKLYKQIYDSFNTIDSELKNTLEHMNIIPIIENNEMKVEIDTIKDNQIQPGIQNIKEIITNIRTIFTRINKENNKTPVKNLNQIIINLENIKSDLKAKLNTQKIAIQKLKIIETYNKMKSEQIQKYKFPKLISGIKYKIEQLIKEIKDEIIEWGKTPAKLTKKKTQELLKIANDILNDAENENLKITTIETEKDKIEAQYEKVKISSIYLQKKINNLAEDIRVIESLTDEEEIKKAKETLEKVKDEKTTKEQALKEAKNAEAAGSIPLITLDEFEQINKLYEQINILYSGLKSKKNLINTIISDSNNSIANLKQIIGQINIDDFDLEQLQNMYSNEVELNSGLAKLNKKIDDINQTNLDIEVVIGKNKTYLADIKTQISTIIMGFKGQDIENILERATNIRLLNDYIKFYDSLYKGGEIIIEYKDGDNKDTLTTDIKEKLKTLFNIYYKTDINIIKINKLTIYIEILYIFIQLYNNGDKIKQIYDTMIYSIEKIIEFINYYDSYKIEFNTTHKKLIDSLKKLIESCKIITTYDINVFAQFKELYDAAKDLIFLFHNRTKILANQLYDESLLFCSKYLLLYEIFSQLNNSKINTDIIKTYIEQIENFKTILVPINYNKNDTKKIIELNTEIYNNNNFCVDKKEKIINYSDGIDTQIKRNLLQIIDGEIKTIKDVDNTEKIKNIVIKFQKELKLVEPKESKIIEISKKIWEKIKFRKSNKLIPTLSAKPTPTTSSTPSTKSTTSSTPSISSTTSSIPSTKSTTSSTPSISSTPSATPSIKSTPSSIPVKKEELNIIYEQNFPDDPNDPKDPQEKDKIKNYLANIPESIFVPLVAKYLAYIDPKQIGNVPKTINNIFIRFFGMAIFVALSIFIILMATTKGEFGPKNLDVIMGFNTISAAIITLVIFLSFIACEKLNGVAINLNIYKILFFIGLFVFIFLFLSIMDYSGINVYLYVSEKNKDLINPNLQKINELRNEDSIFKTFIYIFIIFVVLFIGYNMLNMFRLSYAFKVGNGINNSKWSIILFFIINIIGINITLDIITKYKTYKNHESSYFTMNFIYSLFSGFIYLIYQNIRKKETAAP